MLHKSFSVVLALVIILLGASVSNAQVPQLINYQGVLTDADGNPINDEDCSIQFKIYDSETEGTELWSETQTVTITEGLFSVLLGSVTPIPYSVFDGSDKYLSLKVESDPEMTPRKRLVSVGYSFRAYDSDKVDGKHASAFVQTGEANSISTDMIQDNAVTADKISPAIVSSVDGVSNDTGNIDLVAGSNVTITPDDANNRITISASGGTGGDDLGNHTASQNIKLNGHWLSGDGGNEGVYIGSNGNVGVGVINPTSKLVVDGDIVTSEFYAQSHIEATLGHIKTGSPSSSYGNGDIAATKNILADNDVKAGGSIVAGSPSFGYSSGDVAAADDVKTGKNVNCGNDVTASRHIISYNGYIRTGTPSSSYTDGDIVSTRAVIADYKVLARNNIETDLSLIANLNIRATTGSIKTGTPSSSYGNGDIAATQNVLADNNIIANNNVLTESPSCGYGANDIASTDDVWADDDIIAGDKLITNGISTLVGGCTVKVYNKTLYYYCSSAAHKDNIQELKDDFYKILQANPKSFTDKNFGFKEIGYIAEEFDQQGLNNLVIYKDGQPIAIKYELISL